MRKHLCITIISTLVMLLWSCSPSKKKDKPNADEYGEYEIADTPSSDKKPKVYTVEIKQMKFEPAILNVHKGDEIVWINRDIVDHDVTEENKKSWTSSKLPTGASWHMVVTKSELYYCSIHLVMKGKIVVDGADLSMVDPSSEITMCR